MISSPFSLTDQPIPLYFLLINKRANLYILSHVVTCDKKQLKFLEKIKT